MRPNESPNVAALRSDTGPIHVHPVTSSMPTCTRPLTNSTSADDVRHPLDPPSVDPDPPQCSPELGHDDILPLDVKRS